jgi:vitamin B12 transporter
VDVRIDAQYLDSVNRNALDDVRTDDTLGSRTRIGGQLVHRFALGGTGHDLIGAIERGDEDFATRDRQFGGAGDRDLSRGRTAFVGEWRATWGNLLITDVAVRHDDFNRFQDETTVRANAVLNIASGVAILAGYGEGIAQPSFIDLYGFSASSDFIGNPSLSPETSRGYEAGLRWTGTSASIEATVFSNALRHEIVEDFSVFPNYTVVNAPGKSRRRGIEVAGEWRPTHDLRLTANYTYLDTRERSVADTATLREVRRPRHTANVYADWRTGPLTLGGSLAYVGSRRDSDFDQFPSPRIKLGDYVLAGARVAYSVTPMLELFGRVENALDEDYQDLVGYNTPGRKVFGGVRAKLGE